MPKYEKSDIEGLWKVDDGSGVPQWTIDARKLFPKPEEFRAGPIRYNTENRGLKKVKEGVPGQKEATYEVSSDVTDHEGKPISFGTREHELRAKEREENAGIRYITLPGTGESHPVDSEKGQLHMDIHQAFINSGELKSPYILGKKDQQEPWDSSTYDPEKDGYASEFGYDPEDDISWENKRAKKAGQQTEYGWKAMLKESRPDGNSVFSRWLATKVLGAQAGTKSGKTTRVPFYWTGDKPENGEDLAPSGYFTDEDFRKSSKQGEGVEMGPERYFRQAGAAEAQTLNLLSVTGDPNKKGQEYKTVNIPERADYEAQQAGTQTDNVAAAKAVTQAVAPAPKAKKTTRATPTPTAQPAPKVNEQTGTVNTPMKIVCPTCNAVSGDDPVAFHMEHQRLHAQ